jgi:hypothetical protein
MRKDTLLLRCSPATGECGHVAGLRSSVVRVAQSVPAAELDAALLDACAAAIARADQLHRLHLITAELDSAC